MEKFEITTQHGKLIVKVEVEADPGMLAFGITAAQFEKAMTAIIAEKMHSMGGSTTRPVHWDN